MTVNSHKSLFITLVTAAMIGLTGASCSQRPIDDQVTDWLTDADGTDTLFTTSDLSTFEVSGRVRRLHTLTYYDIIPDGKGGFTIPDSMNCTETVVYFDTLGRYVPRRDERIRRDSAGRIVRWEDHRPNLRRIHGGFLRDTLAYTRLSDNVLTTSGMGEFAVTVYDNDHRIVGQFSDPMTDGDQTAVFNVYLEADSLANWTSRMGVWTTRSHGCRPHVSYTLDRRTIDYWK
ncbi:MAG: hypothetical protein K2K55_04435 [Duncaniella sp.]|nr:hypothetical protein [Duncaniella sp.]